MNEGPLNAILFGGCRVHQPMRSIARSQKRLVYDGYGPIGGIHNVADILQTIAVLQGRLSVPQELRSWCNMPSALEPAPNAHGFEDLDLSLIELSSPTELVFRGLSLNQYAVRTRVLNPMRKRGGEAAKVATAWFHKGLKEFNEGIRDESAAHLLGFLPDDDAESALVRDIVREIRPRKSNVLKGLERVRNLLRCPIGVIVYIFRYMPDGRSVSWPPGFRTDVETAAKRLGFTLFDPTPLVVSYGVERAFRTDRENHYVSDFLPIMAEELIAFAETVGAGRCSAARAAPPSPEPCARGG